MFWLAVSSGQWFFADEWDFIATRARPPLSDPGAVADMLLTPHNEHWSTLPILVYRAVFGVVGLRAYWPYLIVLYVFHLTVVGLLVRLLRRSGVPVAMRCFAVAIFVVYGAGAENLLWAFQFAWMGACIAGLLLAEIVDVPPGSLTRRRLALAWLVGIAGLMCAGVGVSMVAAGVVVALLRHGWRCAVWVGAIPAATQVVWTIAYGRNAQPVETRWTSVAHKAVGYSWRAITSTFDRTLGLPGLGVLVVVALLVFVAREAGTIRHTHASALGLAAAALPFLGLVAIGRVEVDNPNASRYSYVLFVLLAPLTFVAMGRTFARGNPADPARSRVGPLGASQWQWLACVAGVLAVITSLGTLSDAAALEGRTEKVTKRTIVAAFAVANSSFAAPEAIPDPQSVDLTITGLRALLVQGKVPAGTPDPQSLTAVLAQSSVDVTPEPRVPLDGRGITIASLGRVTAVAVESGCLGFSPQGPSPQVSLLPRQPTSVKVVPLIEGILLITVRRDGRSATARPIPVSANNPVFVNMADPRNEYVLTFPEGGMTKACGMGQNLPG